MTRRDLHPAAIALVVVMVLAAVITGTLVLLARFVHPEPREPEWVDVGHGIYQACTDTGRSVLKDSASGDVVLDRDDTACEAIG